MADDKPGSRRLYHKRYREAHREERRLSCRKYHASHREECRLRSKEYREAHREELKEKRRLKNLALRREVIAAYGGRCECCGESRNEFLSIDHAYGDGATHRKQSGSGSALYRWLKKNGFPKGRFRLLCHNCNFSRGIYGYCPHESKKKKGRI